MEPDLSWDMFECDIIELCAINITDLPPRDYDNIRYRITCPHCKEISLVRRVDMEHSILPAFKMGHNQIMMVHYGCGKSYSAGIDDFSELEKTQMW